MGVCRLPRITVRTYCGINLDTRDFYIGSTKQLSRRLKSHEDTKRVGDNVFWLISDEHDDPDREEEQFYLDFYWGTDKCLNLAGNAKLGDNYGRIFTDSHKESLSRAMKGNTNGKSNKGKKGTKKRRLFGRQWSDPDTARKNCSEGQKQRFKTSKGKQQVKAAGRIGCLTRWGGFKGQFPSSSDYRTALSSDFVDYFAIYGWW